MLFSRAIVDYFMGKMISLYILLIKTPSILAIIVYVTYSGIEIQDYLPPWQLAVHFTLCLLTHTNMVSTDIHTLVMFRG
jgi:hypothetical protein